PFTGILITEAARAEGGWLLNKDGYRYLQDYDLGKPESKPVLRSMELGPRDRLSQAFVKEQEKGRTLEGPYGDYVHLDCRHLGAKIIDKKLPFVRELCLKYQNIDPVKEMIPVRLVNALLRKTNGAGRKERVATLREDMLKITEASAGIYRNGPALERAAQKLRALQERSCDVALDDHSYTFNTELTSALELSYMLDLAEAIAHSALQRTESRGSHQRTDFPARDDQKFLAHSLAVR